MALMATLDDWNAYMGLLQELALVEDDLREAVDYSQSAGEFAQIMLFERFGVDSPAESAVGSE